MKAQVRTAALVFAVAAVPAFSGFTGFAQVSGVAHPDSDTISATEDAVPQTVPESGRRPLVAKPSAAVSAPAADSSVTYGPYVPYTGVTGSASVSAAGKDALGDVDADSQIVTSVPERQGELREGTLLKTQIRQTLSTASTIAGTRFTAEVMEPVEKDGKVVIPVGSILEGQVTQVHGGRRITGAAAMHLETRDVMLPDGTHYVVHAQLIDTSRSDFRVTDEGTLKRKDHPKEMLAVAGGVTGASAVAGAMVGGGVGAAVGAGIGAGVSTVIWLKQDRQATLKKDVQLVFSLTTPMILTPLHGGAEPLDSTGGAQ
ncbi:MAG: hypothetical protein M3Y50_02905 [Acidobacteriota bacterium]|nr:hypothetical protein [Acidobacteriota bacterium]